MTVRQRLRRIVEDAATPFGRAFDLGVMAIIALSMVALSVDTLPDLSPGTRRALAAIEALTLALFVAEYVLRLWVAEKPLRYATSFFGVVDFLAVAPQLLLLGFDTRLLRSLRLLRLVRLGKLARYNAAVRRLHLALRLAWEELVLFGFASAVLLFIAAAGIYQFEHEAQPQAFASVFHSLWWAIATLTTVGYGDVVPVTAGGRVFTFLVLLVGLGVVAMPAGLVASALTRARQAETEE